MSLFGSRSTRRKYNDTFDPAEQAYRWGRSGIEVDTQMVENWLDWHNEHHLSSRVANLTRKVSGPGVTFHHFTVAALGVGVFLAALFVDYNIINEFWSRALSNEFGEVPPALATTVAAKSMQVLFGTLAVHYLISHIGHGGRVAYSLFIFAISAMMIIGIGLLWANNSLPAGSQVFGFDVNSSAQNVDDFMKGLGMKPPKAAPVPAEIKALKKYQVVVWLFSLSVIFLVVASIGAMALHSAQRAFTAFTGGALYDDQKDVRHGHHMRDSLQHALADQQLFASDRSAFLNAKLVEFISIYTDGLFDGLISPGRRRELLETANASVRALRSRGWVADSSGSSDDDEDDNVVPIGARPAAHMDHAARADVSSQAGVA
jgi:hypothetical protein